ncbi:hypothetical protein [Streptococcus cristatus]|jgi:hypothetical protein|uniref:Lipoprotein n=1 Tax=Streptococcus cristatus TaxID=45634 RepID=A0A3R9L2R6_STRCR|nr:hypothetical protein [Streptococcus cristatus]RSJ89528.1 hypothetical protein D8792_06055 [Streptococcus cristatus]
MKTKTYIKLMAATVLASSLLLGACGHKEETKTSASANKTVQTSSSSKVASSSKTSSAPKASSNASSNKTVGQAEQVQKAVESVQPSQNQTQQGVDQQVQAQQNTQAQPSQSQQAPSQQTMPTQPTKPNQATQPAQNPATDRQLQNKQAETNARYKGVLNMVDGDFSAAAGSWTDAGGSTVTVSAGGQFSVKSANGTVNTYHVASYAYTLDDGRYTAQLGSAEPSAPKLGIQITTGADGKVASVQLIK